MITKDVFLDHKQDYSPFLVHLTKDYEEISVEGFPFTRYDAKQVLEQIIVDSKLSACYCHCLFNTEVKSLASDLVSKFKVICFTETPIDQIATLLQDVEGRNFKPKPYGLVFTKDFIRIRGGNPVIYVTSAFADSFWTVFKQAREDYFSHIKPDLFALVNKCDERFDFHWEREWRIVGDLTFEHSDVCYGLCPENEIKYF